MLHELQHTAQYVLKGGEQQFLSEYILHAAGRIVACGCVDVHDDINTERDANAKSSNTLGQLGWFIQVTSRCAQRFKLALHYTQSDNTWTTVSWWEIDPSQATFLGLPNGQRLSTRNSILYFYAYSDSGEWAGPDSSHSWPVDGQNRNFREARYASAGDYFALPFDCN